MAKMKICLKRNMEWIDILPMLMFDWGRTGYLRLYVGWIFWVVEFQYKR